VSRIGKLPVPVPKGVTVTIKGSAVEVKGPKGTIKRDFVGVSMKQDGGAVIVEPKGEDREVRALWGLARALVANMVEGAEKGFKKTLMIEGTGYRVEQTGKGISLNVGYSNPQTYTPPEGVKVVVTSQTVIDIEGIDKHLVGQVAANIRAIRKPEPYKGKGIRYSDEVVRRKAGKTGK
jgi:large subunit ribosomal protein L6